MSRLMNDVTVIQHVVTETPVDSAKQLRDLHRWGRLPVRHELAAVHSDSALVAALGAGGEAVRQEVESSLDVDASRTASISTLVEEVIAGIRVVKSFVQAQREERRFKADIQTAMDLALRRAAVLAVFIPVITFFTFAAAAAVLWYGGGQVIEGTVTPGDLFAFVLFAGILIGPFGSAARVFAQIKEAQGAMQRVFDILDTRPEVADTSSAVNLRHPGTDSSERRRLRLRCAVPVLSDISFDAAAGEMIAIVGPTGSGKTTMINLLHRFYDTTEGTLTIDGYDLRHVRLDSLYRQIGLVPQETILFGGTIMENIRYGRETASEDEILDASGPLMPMNSSPSCPTGIRRWWGKGCQPLRRTAAASRHCAGHPRESARAPPR